MDNPVGSLTKLQKSLIIGSILGDGYIRIFPGRKNALLEINHSFKAKEYVDWKYSVLENVVGSRPKMRKGNGQRIAYRFYTKQLPEITKLHKLFYRNGKKIIPENLKIDSTILAVWYMDDGSNCGNKNFYLNTQQFNLEDQNRMRASLLRGFDLKTKLNKDKIYWRIRFLQSSVPKLMNLIDKYIIPTMRYKLSYNPVETCRLRRQSSPNVFVS